jgi:hypothetical protein
LILYTIVPVEVVMEGSDSYQPVYTELPWKGGGTLLVEQCGISSARVVRLISSNAVDYLDPALQPGSIIEFKAENQAQK